MEVVPTAMVGDTMMSRRAALHCQSRAVVADGVARSRNLDEREWQWSRSFYSRGWRRRWGSRTFMALGGGGKGRCA
nr:unnamed protein product [Digitaria exilis]